MGLMQLIKLIIVHSIHSQVEGYPRRILLRVPKHTTWGPAVPKSHLWWQILVFLPYTHKNTETESKGNYNKILWNIYFPFKRSGMYENPCLHLSLHVPYTTLRGITSKGITSNFRLEKQYIRFTTIFFLSGALVPCCKNKYQHALTWQHGSALWDAPCCVNKAKQHNK